MLDARLRAVANFAGTGRAVADIGTDHGYLAAELYAMDNSRLVIAGDKNAGPCQAARKTLQEKGYAQAVEVRQGDGLAILQPHEAECVCLAGMGGKLITDILGAQPEVFHALQAAVLQPQGGADLLRSWLYDQGWHVADEALAEAEGRLYQILLAEPGSAPKPNRLALLAGPILLEKRPPLFTRHIGEILQGYAKVIKGMEKSRQPDRERLAALQQEQKALEGIL